MQQPVETQSPRYEFVGDKRTNPDGSISELVDNGDGTIGTYTTNCPKPDHPVIFDPSAAVPIPAPAYKPVYPQVAELATMSAQEVFDRAAVHLLKQNKQAAIGTVCQYRGPSGTCCAVGVLIPEELYDDRFEDNSVGRLAHVAEPGSPVAVLVKTHLPILRSLQMVHDASRPALWPGRLRRVAEDFGLSAAAIDALPEVAA